MVVENLHALGRALLLCILVSAAMSMAAPTTLETLPKDSHDDNTQQVEPRYTLRRRRLEGAVTPQRRRELGSTVSYYSTGGYFQTGNFKSTGVGRKEGTGGRSSNEVGQFEPVAGTTDFEMADMVMSLLMEMQPGASATDHDNYHSELPLSMIVWPFSAPLMSGYISPLSLTCDTIKEVVIDFEADGYGYPLTRGNLINDTVKFDVASVSARTAQDGRRSFASPFDDGMIFDTRVAPELTRDKDLIEDPSLGNILIIAKKRLNPSNPDDNGQGGIVRLQFDEPVFLVSITLIDVEEGGSVRIYSQDNVLKRPMMKDEIMVPPGDDGQVRVMTINTTDVVMFTLTTPGSGGFDNIVFRRPECR